MRASHQGKHEDIHEIPRCECADNVTMQSVVNARIFMSEMIIWRGVSASLEQLRETSSPTAKTIYRDTSHASQERIKASFLLQATAQGHELNEKNGGCPVGRKQKLFQADRAALVGDHQGHKTRWFPALRLHDPREPLDVWQSMFMGASTHKHGMKRREKKKRSVTGRRASLYAQGSPGGEGRVIWEAAVSQQQILRDSGDAEI
ncbi:hypothetical protein DER44DRAFT_748716 [Fusarium oxysporum]|nr:hypothetical protein DER44DRAFT_748716 [Fusarium oxysporum]